MILQKLSGHAAPPTTRVVIVPTSLHSIVEALHLGSKELKVVHELGIVALASGFGSSRFRALGTSSGDRV